MADEPAKKAPAKAAPEPVKKAAPRAAFQPVKEPLPTTKPELAALAINKRGVPSYEAWAMTVDELTKKLEG